jgi:hypothetical protein
MAIKRPDCGIEIEELKKGNGIDRSPFLRFYYHRALSIRNLLAGHVPALRGHFLSPGNIDNLSVLPDIARSFCLAGKEMRGLGGTFQGGVNSSKLFI